MVPTRAPQWPGSTPRSDDHTKEKSTHTKTTRLPGSFSPERDIISVTRHIEVTDRNFYQTMCESAYVITRQKHHMRHTVRLYYEPEPRARESTPLPLTRSHRDRHTPPQKRCGHSPSSTVPQFSTPRAGLCLGPSRGRARLYRFHLSPRGLHLRLPCVHRRLRLDRHLGLLRLDIRLHSLQLRAQLCRGHRSRLRP